MSTRDELLASIANTIKDYRAGEIAEPTPEHVDRWVHQFRVEVQVPLLAELNHVLACTYFSKQFVTEFFARQVQHKPIVGDDPCAFWRNANFLNIQQHGHSQRDILALFEESLEAHCGLVLADCGSDGGPFFYLDDVLFSGGRIGNDLKAWIRNKAPLKAKVQILVIGTHDLGEWQCKKGLNEEATKAGKTITFEIWRAFHFENRKKYKDQSEVLWPACIPADAALSAYMAEEKRFPFEPRTAGGTLINNVFSSEDGRQLIEREMLLAGVRIRAGCLNPKQVIRPLGFSPFGLGFGSTVVTYRNCPNNCPLALWWGDPDATSGPFHWYPLLPRKTYQHFDISDFDIEL